MSISRFSTADGYIQYMSKNVSQMAPFSFIKRYLLRGLVDSCAVQFLACFVSFIAFHVISTDFASNCKEARQRWTFSE